MTEPTADTFGKRLRALLETSGPGGTRLTVAQFARDNGFEVGTVRKWIYGTSEPSRENFVKICRALGVGAGYFYPELGEGSLVVTREELDRFRQHAEHLEQRLADLEARFLTLHRRGLRRPERPEQ